MIKISRLDTRQEDFAVQLKAMLDYEAEQDLEVAGTVEAIIQDVRKRGDLAVLEYTRRFDRLELASASKLELTDLEMTQALEQIPSEARQALTQAAERIRVYHEKQKSVSWEYTEADGTRLGQKITPLDRVGLYVPGGKAAYPSSVLMNAIPAKVAGVAELIMVVPTPDGARNPWVLAAAKIAGVDRVFTVGGAQAVAALAYGTDTIPAVDKITGPGNMYVAEAKRRVFGKVGIDMIAGPSEILVLADGSTPAEWTAMDMFSQAEHDEMAQAILLCPDSAYLDAVQAAMERLLPQMPRHAVIRQSLEDRGVFVLTASMEQACEIANTIAAEHLEICAQTPRHWAGLIRHAGALFLGAYSSESLGDYCAGPNHVLPTMGSARFSSPLGVYDFQKRSSMIEVSKAGAQTLGPIAATLAYGEGLQAHARSAELRLSPLSNEEAKANTTRSA
jgi:histidinol dehydrogenase